MKTYLKIKIKSLADEARTIRNEEKKTSGETRAGLHQHRVIDVRREQRSALLAYGFLRGRDYRVMERTSRTKPDWKRIEKLVRKYTEEDPRITMQRFEQWVQAATA